MHNLEYIFSRQIAVIKIQSVHVFSLLESPILLQKYSVWMTSNSRDIFFWFRSWIYVKKFNEIFFRIISVLFYLIIQTVGKTSPTTTPIFLLSKTTQADFLPCIETTAHRSRVSSTLSFFLKFALVVVA